MATVKMTYLSAAECAELAEQAFTVLHEVGVIFNTPEALELLAEAGAIIDRETSLVRLPRELVERCLAMAPRQVLLAARDPRNDVLVGGGAPLSITSDGTATYVLDDNTGERRSGTADDLRTIMRLFDALPEVDYVWPTISARDLDPVTANLEIEAISLRSCSKHVQDEVRSLEYVEPLLDILEAAAGAPMTERPIFSVINCTIAPLMHDAEMTPASIALARAGVPIVIMPMPLMGTTAPLSAAGVTVITLAEIASAVVLFQLAAPGCPLIAAPEPALADLRGGLYLCATPEASFANMACVDVLKSWGLPVQGEAFGGDGKAPDFQDGLEGAFHSLLGALGGSDTLVGLGSVDGAQMTSLATIVLHAEAAGMLKKLLEDTPFDAASTLLEDIRAVGAGGHFLACRSTRQRARDAWQPAVLRRGTFDSHRGTTLIEDALERARHLLATHEVTPMADDVERHIDSVIAGFSAAATA
ncbi:MAG: trimethylamine methyltransferase family protein [Thermoleophilia bacterium]|nr:trimethylamine methyltransferase family protein [Thermoleophilia bacterium]